MRFVSIFFILTSLIASSRCQRAVGEATRGVNDETLNLIKGFEGWRPCAYADPVGLLTIGYGHLIKPGDGFNGKSCITPDRGVQLLRSDLLIARKCISQIVRVPMDDNQFGALVSWAYNVGCGAASNSLVVEKVNAKSKPDVVCTELRKWRLGGGQILPGLVRRRDAECALYKS